MVRPSCRPFSWTDPSISFPYTDSETFPSWTLLLISILPVVVYVVGEAVRHVCLGYRYDAMMARDPCNENKWLMMEDQLDGGGAAQNAGEGPSRCDAASPLTFPSPLMDSALSGDRQGEIDVLVIRTLSSANIEAREAQVGSSTVNAASSREPVSPGASFNTHDGHTDNRGPAAASSPGKQRARTHTLAHRWQRFLFHAHIWFLTQAFSLAFGSVLMTTIKVSAGRLRPDFLARLRKEGFTPQSTGVDWCAVPKDGRVSFPSGHSSIAFSAIVPFCFYVLHLLQAFRRSGVSLWRIFMGLAPLILPITVAVSRTLDNRHYFDDIAVGSAIGIVSAVIAVSATMVADDCTGHLVPRLAYH